jgi:peptidylprolyl isomerase
MRRIVAVVVSSAAVLALATGCSQEKSGWNVNLGTSVAVSQQGTSEPVVMFAKGGKPPTTLVVKDAVLGKGPEVKPGSSIFINYMGVVTSSGQTIYSSWRVGHGTTITLSKTPQAWQQGLVGQKVGGTRVLLAPPSLLGAKAGSNEARAGDVLYVISLVSVS